MTTAAKTAVAAVAVVVMFVAAVLMLPLLIAMISQPSQGTQQFYASCMAYIGIRGAVVANPPADNQTPGELLLKINQTATTLGFGRQGATVTAAIAIRATGLVNAANPSSPDTMRYEHDAIINTGAGALGLPLTWATPEELMTPEVSTAVALDHMVDTEPRWRDADPAELAAQITGLATSDFTQPVADAQARLAGLPNDTPATPTSLAVLTSPAQASPHTTTTTSAPAPTPTPTAPLDPEQASSAAATAPAAATCLNAMTTPLPATATASNPAGPIIATAAQRAVGTAPAEPSTQASPSQTTPATPTQPAGQLDTQDSAHFVSSLLSATLGANVPVTIAEQLRLGNSVVSTPEPGDVIFTDISANAGPHLAGIAVDETTMVTVLPGHPNPEWVRYSNNRVIRRIEMGAAA